MIHLLLAAILAIGETKVTAAQAGRLAFDQLVRLSEADQTLGVDVIRGKANICAEPLSPDVCTPSGVTVDDVVIVIWQEP